jgi:hypothetical protein
MATKILRLNDAWPSVSHTEQHSRELEINASFFRGQQVEGLRGPHVLWSCPSGYADSLDGGSCLQAEQPHATVPKGAEPAEAQTAESSQEGLGQQGERWWSATAQEVRLR